MTLVATVLLLAALPVLLWPLLRPGGEPIDSHPDPDGGGSAPDLSPESIEEINLDLVTGRIDQPEADRRLAELRPLAPPAGRPD